jgi:hypothetical protein
LISENALTPFAFQTPTRCMVVPVLNPGIPCNMLLPCCP